MKTTKASAQTANANTKKEINLFAELNKTMFISEKGNAKNDLYKIEAYFDIIKKDNTEALTDKEKKIARRKLRNLKESFAASIVFASKKDSAKFEELKSNFIAIYNKYFVLNDFSLQSVVSANASEENKKLMQTMLDLIKK